jgi:transcriptional regulator with XRE-family HTH domain
MHHDNTLGAYRRRHALYQHEIGALLGLSADAISNYERATRAPLLEAALGLELIFGVPLAQMFPNTVIAAADRIIRPLQELSMRADVADREISAVRQRFIANLGERLARILPDV